MQGLCLALSSAYPNDFSSGSALNLDTSLYHGHLLALFTCKCDNSYIIYHYTYKQSTVVWKKFTVGYFHVKFVRGEIFSSLGVSNE